jgi:sporulation protein YlmC with PRC-barrel domain
MAKSDDRSGRDIAGVGPYARERETLVPMSTISWTVSDGEPDIRGWDVCTVSGKQLGAVSDLLVDEAAHEVVMLDVDLPGTDRHTFVPIRVVQIDRARRVVVMDSADLPASGIARIERAPDDRRNEVGTVRYADTDRPVERRPVSEEARRDAAPGDPMSASERRRMDRRRIDRLSTEF